MLTLSTLFENEKFKNQYELVQWARKEKLIEPQKRDIIELKEGEYKVPRKERKKFKGINPKTGRKKNIKKTVYLKTTVKPEDRTLKNLPKDSKNKSKVRFQDWLMFKNTSRSKYSVGQAANGCWYGYSHRAIGEFCIGKEIKSTNIIGNKYTYDLKGNEKTDKTEFKPYKIKTDDEAFEHAERFAKNVS